MTGKLRTSQVELTHPTPRTRKMLIPTARLTDQTTLGQLNSILTISSQRWHQIPQVKGLVPQDCPSTLSSPPPSASDTNCKTRLLHGLLTGYKSEVLMTHSLDSIYLLEQFTELSKPV